LPVYFGQNSWQRERSTRKAWEDRDILNASRNIAIRSSWRERAEAIRRRKDRERENSGAPPDTIGN
jgi:nuclear transport factor 2 (NTF2) superfamily protein